MKTPKRKYEFETEVPVPGIEEIMKVASDFSESSEKVEKPMEKKVKTKNAPDGPTFDKTMSTMRKNMMKLAEAVAEDESKEQKPEEESTSGEKVAKEEIKEDSEKETVQEKSGKTEGNDPAVNEDPK